MSTLGGRGTVARSWCPVVTVGGGQHSIEFIGIGSKLGRVLPKGNKSTQLKEVMDGRIIYSIYILFFQRRFSSAFTIQGNNTSCFLSCPWSSCC